MTTNKTTATTTTTTTTATAKRNAQEGEKTMTTATTATTAKKLTSRQKSLLWVLLTLAREGKETAAAMDNVVNALQLDKAQAVAFRNFFPHVVSNVTKGKDAEGREVIRVTWRNESYIRKFALLIMNNAEIIVNSAKDCKSHGNGTTKATTPEKREKTVEKFVARIDKLDPETIKAILAKFNIAA